VCFLFFIYFILCLFHFCAVYVFGSSLSLTCVIYFEVYLCIYIFITYFSSSNRPTPTTSRLNYSQQSQTQENEQQTQHQQQQTHQPQMEMSKPSNLIPFWFKLELVGTSVVVRSHAQ
jgi:hypothetical protein